MNYSISTLELALDCNNDKFYKLQDKSYGTEYDNKNEGIKVEYQDSTYNKKIKIFVNPTMLLFGNYGGFVKQKISQNYNLKIGHDS